MNTPKDVEEKIFPRLLALSELGWCDNKEKRNEYEYKYFVKKVKHFI